MKKRTKIILIIIGVVVLGIGITFGAFFGRIYSILEKIHRPDVNIIEKPSDMTEIPELTEYVPTEIMPTEISTQPSEIETMPSTDRPTEPHQIVTEPYHVPTEGKSSHPKEDDEEEVVYYDRYYEPPGTNTPIWKQDRIDPNVFNFILLARDSRNAKVDRGRTDVMLVISYNKQTKDLKLISLQRDSLVPISSKLWDRLNTAYFYGGVGLCLNTINTLFGLDIQRFITVNLDSFYHLIDLVDGLDVTLTKEEAEAFSKTTIPGAVEGLNHFNGKQIARYVNNRSIGLDHDEGRTRRQRNALTALIEKAKGMSMLKLADVIEAASVYMATNFSSNELMSLASDIFVGGYKIKSAQMPFKGTYEGYWFKPNMLVQKIDIDANREKLHDYIYNY